jgi:hypothetical protein
MRAAAIGAVVSFAGAASADGRDPAAAEALFLAGREAMQRADYATACPKFSESERLDPAAGTLINLSDCEEHLGLLANAWEHWREAIDQLAPEDPRLPVIKERATSLEKRLAHLTIKLVASAPRDTRVTRDDVEIGDASRGIALPVNSGEHVIVVTSEGRNRKFTIAVPEGESREIVVEPEPAPPAPPVVLLPPVITHEAPLPESASSTRMLGFALVGVGATGIVIGSVTGILAIGKKSVVSDNCDASKACNQTGYDAAGAGRTLSAVSTVAVVAGLAGLAAGTFFILTSPPAKTSVKARAASTVTPSVHPGGASILFTRTF